MTDLKYLLLIPMIAGSLALSGCGGGDGHDNDSHEEHSEGDGHVHGSEGGDQHGIEYALGDLEIAGSVLGVSIGGEPGPNVSLHIDIELKSGPTPAAIRAWVGNESATGSVKGKAVGSNGDYHADAMCPAELTQDTALWIEVESADGTRAAKSLALPE